MLFLLIWSVGIGVISLYYASVTLGPELFDSYFAPGSQLPLLNLLLEANTETFGPQDRALGMLRDTGDVVLQWRIPTRDVELDGFCAELEAFVNQVEQWRLALENFRPAAEEAAARDEEVPAMGLPASGFISV